MLRLHVFLLITDRLCVFDITISHFPKDALKVSAEIFRLSAGMKDSGHTYMML